MATAATAKKEFDRDRFYKCVLLMDSPNEFERQRATTQALQLCTAAGMRFFDAAAEICGKDNKRIAALETQLEEARRGGDELADELQRCRATIAEYRKAERTRHRYCRPCETKRRALGALTGLMILAGWFCRYDPRDVTPRWTGYGVMLAALPLVFLLIRWGAICFKRKHHWVTWRDNDVFRTAAAAWNRFLGKFVIEVED